MPVLDFLQKGISWLHEQSQKRDQSVENVNPNLVKYAKQHTFTTKDWTSAHSWKVSTAKQIRYLPQVDVFIAVAPGVKGDLTDERTNHYVTTFTDCSWSTYDKYTTMFHNVFILQSDPTRPEKYDCTCAANAKTFTCTHSLGVALMRRILTAPRAAEVRLIGQKRRRGRRPMAAPAWERMEFALQSPVQHPQQDEGILLGSPVGLLATDLIGEVV